MSGMEGGRVDVFLCPQPLPGPVNVSCWMSYSVVEAVEN